MDEVEDIDAKIRARLRQRIDALEDARETCRVAGMSAQEIASAEQCLVAFPITGNGAAVDALESALSAFRRGNLRVWFRAHERGGDRDGE